MKDYELYGEFIKFYFPKDFYNFTKENGEGVSSLDELLNQMKDKIEDLQKQIDEINVDIDLAPVLKRLEQLESLTNELKESDLKHTNDILNLTDIKLDKSVFNQYKESIDDLLEMINNEIDSNKLDFDSFKTKVNSDIESINTKMLELITKTELDLKLKELKEEIINLIPEETDISEIFNKISILEFDIEELKSKTQSHDIDLQKVIKDISDINLKISGLNVEEINTNINNMLSDITIIKDSLSELDGVKNQISDLNTKVTSLEKIVNDLDLNLITSELEQISKDIEVLKLHDLFNYWINLPENMVENENGELVIDERLTLEMFIDYLLNDKDYSDDFLLINASISNLQNEMITLQNQLDNLDISDIQLDLADIKEQLEELTVIKNNILELSQKIDNNKTETDAKIKELSDNIDSILSNIANILVDYYNKTEIDNFISGINNKLTELETKVLDVYTKSEIDLKLSEIINSIPSGGGISKDDLDKALEPIISDIDSIKASMNIDEFKSQLADFEQQLSDFNDTFKQFKIDYYTKREVDELIEMNIGSGNGGNYILKPATNLKLGGIKVGDGLNITDDGLLSVINKDYNLPVATKEILGGVKVGDNLTITEDGVLSAESGGSEYELPVATKDMLGGIKVGDNLNITEDGVLSAEAIGSEYELPIATKDVLGGIKLGNTLESNSEGVVEVKQSAIALPIATKEKLGIVKVGDNLNITEEGLLSAKLGGLGSNIETTTLTVRASVPDTVDYRVLVDNTGVYGKSNYGTRGKLTVSAPEGVTISGGNIDIGTHPAYVNLKARTKAERSVEMNDTLLVKGASTLASVQASSLNVTGEKNAIHPSRDGVLKTPAYETMGTYIGDIQEIEVAEGVTEVLLKDLFLDITEIEKDYHVFLSVYSDANAYVSDRDFDRFYITSNKSTKLSYEIKKHRLGYTDEYVLTDNMFIDMQTLFPK